MATDIAVRLADLRQHLGVNQPAFAKLFGRGRKQVSAWENQRQAPPPAVLEWAAEQHGWPLEMFAEGGPMPSTVVNRPLTAQSPNGKGKEVASFPSGSYDTLTVGEVRARFNARLDECQGNMPLAEAVWWVGLALRARRSGPPGSP